MSNKILKEFLEQSGIDPTSPNQSAEHERKLKEKERQADRDLLMKHWMERTGGVMESPSLGKHINIPTQIKSGDLDQVTEPHPQFAKYDHSLEKARWREIGGAFDPIEMGDLNTDDY